jgi:HSP20 family protein
MFLTTYQPANNLSHLFDEFFGSNWPSEATTGKAALTPRAYVTENKGVYELEVELPGVRKEDIVVNVEKGVLTVKATRKRGEEEYSYERYFRLAEEIDTAAINAAHENGVLRLSIGRKPEVTPQRIEIK